LAVQAAQFLAVYGRQVCVAGILGSNLFSGPRYVVNSYCLLSDELQKNIEYVLMKLTSVVAVFAFVVVAVVVV